MGIGGEVAICGRDEICRTRLGGDGEVDRVNGRRHLIQDAALVIDEVCESELCRDVSFDASVAHSVRVDVNVQFGNTRPTEEVPRTEQVPVCLNAHIVECPRYHEQVQRTVSLSKIDQRFDASFERRYQTVRAIRVATLGQIGAHHIPDIEANPSSLHTLSLQVCFLAPIGD